MIVDSHTHIFENWHGKCGHDAKNLHLKYIQKNLTRPAARVFRTRDGAPADAQLLLDRQEVDGESPVEGAVLESVNDETDDHNPPAVKYASSPSPRALGVCLKITVLSHALGVVATE